MEKILEICAGGIDSAIAAARGGADRIELCSGLAIGGVTPSEGLIREALTLGPKVNVLIRPREGDFLYSEEEIRVMEHDVELCARLGCNAVVIGALTADGFIDCNVCRRLIALAGGMEVTFHRAIDVCRDPIEAIDTLIELGVHRVLTSGAAPSAMAGVETLARMNQRANGRIQILAGGGVNSANVGELVRLTGVNEVHASAKCNVPSAMRFRRDAVSMGAPGTDEYLRPATDSTEVAAIKRTLSLLTKQ